ncbi:MAG: hypothetical protein GVY18_16125 [Bacteroidetes bacterium]|jgi:hypothetical protein|nr:hypothetical protein [Bacteroidota bacterium]
MPFSTAPLLILSLLALLFAGCAGGGTPEERVRHTLDELFAICQSADGDYRGAGQYVAYRLRADEDRRWNDTYDTSDPDELSAVNRICYDVNGYLNDSDGYTFGTFTTETESEGTWLIQEVLFDQGDAEVAAQFAFLEIDGQPALGDID